MSDRAADVFRVTYQVILDKEMTRRIGRPDEMAKDEEPAIMLALRCAEEAVRVLREQAGHHQPLAPVVVAACREQHKETLTAVLGLLKEEGFHRAGGPEARQAIHRVEDVIRALYDKAVLEAKEKPL